MKKILIIAVAILISTSLVTGQQRDINPLGDLHKGIGTKFNSGYLLNFLTPNNFKMNHQISSSFMMGGGNSMLLNYYMNTMNFNFSFPLKIRLDLGIMNSPYSTFQANNKSQNQFFGNLMLEYKPTKNTFIGLQISNSPMNYSPFYYDSSPFNQNDYFYGN